MVRKKKKDEIREDDLLRQLVAMHYTMAVDEYEDEIEMSEQELADDINMIVEMAGDAVHGMLRGFCDAIVSKAAEAAAED